MKLQTKKKFEFGQLMVIFSYFIFLIWVSLSYLLSYQGKDSNSVVTVSVVTECIAATLGYFTYQGALKNSANKYKTDKDGVPYESSNYETDEFKSTF